MKARDRFTVNDAVRATDRFFAKRARYRARGADVVGIVRGFGVSGQSVRVQILGESTTYRYPMSHWTPVSVDASDPPADSNTGKLATRV